MEQPIITEQHDRVGLIRLNRTAVYNALNEQLMNALTEALNQFEQDENTTCVVITGSDKAFAAGADIDEMRNWDFMEVYKSDFITRNWERLKTFRKPAIASVSGLAMGGGCELAMMCDLVFAADNARFALPEVRLGVLPGAGGTQRLPRAVGKAKAMDLCLTGRFMDAEEAERCGLVSRIYPAERVLEEALATAKQIAQYSQPVLMMLKESVNRAYESSLNEGLLFERRTLHAAFALEDRQEGMSSFQEKRPAMFRHR